MSTHPSSFMVGEFDAGGFAAVVVKDVSSGIIFKDRTQ